LTHGVVARKYSSGMLASFGSIIKRLFVPYVLSQRLSWLSQVHTVGDSVSFFGETTVNVFSSVKRNDANVTGRISYFSSTISNG